MHGACVTDAELQMQTQEWKKRDEKKKKLATYVKHDQERKERPYIGT